MADKLGLRNNGEVLLTKVSDVVLVHSPWTRNQ